VSLSRMTRRRGRGERWAMRGCGSRLRPNFHARLVLVPSQDVLGFSSHSKHGRSMAKVNKHKEMEKVAGEHQRRSETTGWLW
jgi:hypothetical protein